MEQIWNKFRELSWVETSAAGAADPRQAQGAIDPRAPFGFVCREFLLIECNHDIYPLEKT